MLDLRTNNALHRYDASKHCERFDQSRYQCQPNKSFVSKILVGIILNHPSAPTS